jgi:FixJ family two-component response regulator
VFVVDDDAFVRKALARLLGSAGYRTETFASAEELLARSDFETVGCILVDVQMPGLNGLELQHALRTVDRQLPIVFITGHGDIPMSVRAMKAGAVDFITKPFEDDELLKAVALALDKSRAEQNERIEIAGIRRRLSTLTHANAKCFVTFLAANSISRPEAMAWLAQELTNRLVAESDSGGRRSSTDEGGTLA